MKKITRADADKLVSEFVSAILAERAAKGYDSKDAAYYTLGYITSHMAGIIAEEVSLADALRISGSLKRITAAKNADIKGVTA